MPETDSNIQPNQEEPSKIKGEVSTLLYKKGIAHNSLERDNLEIEIISVEPKDLLITIQSLQEDGFDYLQCQGGYDEGPGEPLVCFYNLIAMSELAFKDNSKKKESLREVRVKVFLKRDGDLKVPSVYKYFRGADWQERETFDMYGINFEGHPHPKRLLMPEDWKGWPLRKDYIQPDFYEMQDAY